MELDGHPWTLPTIKYRVLTPRGCHSLSHVWCLINTSSQYNSAPFPTPKLRIVCDMSIQFVRIRDDTMDLYPDPLGFTSGLLRFTSSFRLQRAGYDGWGLQHLISSSAQCGLGWSFGVTGSSNLFNVHIKNPSYGMTVTSITAPSFRGTVTATCSIECRDNVLDLFNFRPSELPQAITFTVTFHPANRLQLISMPFPSFTTTPLDLTHLGVMTGHVMNIEFNVYSRYSSTTKRLSKPRKVFASSMTILGKSEYIDDCKLGVPPPYRFGKLISIQ